MLLPNIMLIPKKAMHQYHTITKPKQEQARLEAERQKQLAEEERLRILELKHQKDTLELVEQRQCELEIREENISDKIFEHNDYTKQSVINDISKNGKSTIILFDINYQTGPQFKHDISHMSSKFGNGVIETNFKQKFFNRLYTFHWLGGAYQNNVYLSFLIVFPYRKISIELSPPSFWSKM